MTVREFFHDHMIVEVAAPRPVMLVPVPRSYAAPGVEVGVCR